VSSWRPKPARSSSRRPHCPAATRAEEEERRRKDRKDRKISAILHETYPVRYWDHDLGPDAPPAVRRGRQPRRPTRRPAPSRIASRCTTSHPDAGRALAGGDASYDITPDGGRIICTWSVPEQGGSRVAVMSIDVASGQRSILLNDPDFELRRSARLTGRSHASARRDAT